MIRYFVCFIALLGVGGQLLGQSGQSYPIRILQGDKEIVISKSLTTIQLERKPFSLRFFSLPYDFDNQQPYCMLLCATDIQAGLDQVRVGDWRYMYQPEEDNKKNPWALGDREDAPKEHCFNNGRSLAADTSTLFIDNNAYLFLGYDPKEVWYVRAVAQKGKYWELERQFTDVFYRKHDLSFAEFPLAELNLKEVYLILFQDKNINYRIEKGELYKIIVQWVSPK